MSKDNIEVAAKFAHDLDQAIQSATGTQEIAILKAAQQKMKNGVYFDKIVADVQWELTPLAIRGNLSEGGKAIYSKILSGGFSSTKVSHRILGPIGSIFQGFR